jgi:hypothetical protein
MQITTVENRRFASAMSALRPDDWAKPTDCARWDVRALAAHVVGSAAGQASPREFVRQVRAGRPVVAEIGAQYWWDGMNEIQVREREALTIEGLMAEWDASCLRALRARTTSHSPWSSPGRPAAGTRPRTVARPSHSTRSSSAAFWPNAHQARESSDTGCPYNSESGAGQPRRVRDRHSPDRYLGGPTAVTYACS